MSGELEQELMKIGFSLYESRAYVSLIKLCSSTMRELSEFSGIPYQKIYEISYKLASKGFVKVIEGRPKLIKLIDPDLAFENYKQNINEIIDNIKKKIMKKINNKEKLAKPSHIRGKEQIKKFIVELLRKSRRVRIVFPKIPNWLLGILKEFNGELYLVTSNNNIKINSKIKYINNLKSKYIIFDDNIVVIFSEDDYITIESCKGCVIQSLEHFNFAFNSIQ
jgi:sugar-specific transcriptional regulator TrmB